MWSKNILHCETLQGLYCVSFGFVSGARTDLEHRGAQWMFAAVKKRFIGGFYPQLVGLVSGLWVSHYSCPLSFTFLLSEPFLGFISSFSAGFRHQKCHHLPGRKYKYQLRVWVLEYSCLVWYPVSRLLSWISFLREVCLTSVHLCFLFCRVYIIKVLCMRLLEG